MWDKMITEAPPILPAERQAGVCLHISALPGAYGIGEIGQAARNFVDTLTRMELVVWQILPTGPTGYGDSPYQAMSTFAGNEMLVDVGDLISMGLITRSDAGELAKLPADSVEFGQLIPAKSELLHHAAQRFRDRVSGELIEACNHYIARNDSAWLNDYAMYRVLKTMHNGRPWTEWDRAFLHREPAALQALANEANSELAEIKIIQFLFHHQWQRLRRYARSRGVCMLGDLPIYVALDSADAWARPDLLQLDRNGRPDQVAGVPPDYFNENGQRWGNPLYAWERHAADGFSWWIARLRSCLELTDFVRIDHFRGFDEYWSVPAESETAREGCWLAGPKDEILIAISKALGQLPIVAENLGQITPEVEALRRRYGLPGMEVLQFRMAEEGFSLSDIGENCVCYTGTHDNDTTVGWFNGSDGDLRSDVEISETRDAALRITHGTPGTIHQDMIQAAFSTAARLAIAPLQDYLGLGSEARFNIPGTAEKNWRWRVLETQMRDEVCNNVANLVRAAGRAAHVRQ